MKHTITLNARRAKSSKKRGTKDPCIAVKNYKGSSYAHEVVILGQDNREAARIIFRPDEPSQSAPFWVETSNSIYMIFHVETEGEDEPVED